MVTKQIGEVSVLSSLSYCGGNLCIIIITTKFFLLFFINFFFVNFARQTINYEKHEKHGIEINCNYAKYCNIRYLRQVGGEV